MHEAQIDGADTSPCDRIAVQDIDSRVRLIRIRQATDRPGSHARSVESGRERRGELRLEAEQR